MYRHPVTPSLQCQRVRFREDANRRRCEDPNNYLAPKSSLALAGFQTASTSSLGFESIETLPGNELSLKRNEPRYPHANRRLAGVVEEEFNQKRLVASSHPQVEAESRRNVQGLLALCKDFKAMGHGQSCSALYGRARGLDILYNRRPAQKQKLNDGMDTSSSDSSSSEEEDANAEPAKDAFHVGQDRPPNSKAEEVMRSSMGSNFTARPPNSKAEEVMRSSMGSKFMESSMGSSAPVHHYHHTVKTEAQLKTIARIKPVLDKNSYFGHVEEQYAGTTCRLSKSRDLRFDQVKAGTVFFRQGDPGRDCYIITSGAVEVWIFNHDKAEDRDRRPTPRVDGRKSKRASTIAAKCKPQESGMAKRLVDGRKDALMPERRISAAPVEIPRFESLEGFSTYNTESMLGVCVATLGQGVHFGELALLSEDPRKATIKCSEDCEVLVIGRKPFERIMRHIKEKMAFFNTHCPGIPCNYGSGGKHVTSHFHLKSYPPGHTFLWEGVRSLESHLYIIHQGTLEIYRYANSSDNPTYVLAARPLDRGSWRGSCARPMTGIAGSIKDEKPVGVALAPERGAQVIWDRLSVGDVLCPLSFIPLSGTEPFTAVASEDCVMYHAGPRQIESLSEGQRAVFQQAAVRSMSRRLRRLDKSLSRSAAPRSIPRAAHPSNLSSEWSPQASFYTPA